MVGIAGTLGVAGVMRMVGMNDGLGRVVGEVDGTGGDRGGGEGDEG